jgi:hypothetical protein
MNYFTLGYFRLLETKVVKNDVMCPFCVDCHVDVHLDVLISLIRFDVDHLFNDEIFWLNQFL